MKLSDDEIEAIRLMPEFRKSLAEVTLAHKAIKEAKEAKKAARRALHAPCDGGGILGTDVSYSCTLCGLELKFRDWSNRDRILEILAQRHWKHAAGGNPMREDGLYGKAAAAADGDWYGSH